MASTTSIARPYAKAILSLAAASASYAQWSKMLEFLALIVCDSRVTTLLKNHMVAAADKANFLCSINPDFLTAEGKNLVQILAYNKRLLVIPELYQVYEELRKTAEQQISLKLVVARDLPPTRMQQLHDLMAEQFKGQLILENELDAGLIAGGKIKIGDRVFESSIKSNLTDLYKHLTQ